MTAIGNPSSCFCHRCSCQSPHFSAESFANMQEGRGRKRGGRRMRACEFVLVRGAGFCSSPLSSARSGIGRADAMSCQILGWARWISGLLPTNLSSRRRWTGRGGAISCRYSAPRDPHATGTRAVVFLFNGQLRRLWSCPVRAS